EPDLVKYAGDIGLDVNRFKKDLHSDEAKERVEQEKKQGETLGVAATPTLYINGREVDLSKLGNPVKDLEEWIELEITMAKKGKGDGGVKDEGGEQDGAAKKDGDGEPTKEAKDAPEGETPKP
ncbi:MAG TPA: hypothetical protein ENK57_14710, partial [Polyangiaceae bacterium]|nr:hypothetical protein [Polyangiaceae bacterium]